MISVFDGEKGYMVNPMMGSSDPVELTGDQLTQVQNNNIYKINCSIILRKVSSLLKGRKMLITNLPLNLKQLQEKLLYTYFLIKDHICW